MNNKRVVRTDTWKCFDKAFTKWNANDFAKSFKGVKLATRNIDISVGGNNFSIKEAYYF